MVDVLGYLKHTKNTLIGNPSAKLALKRTREPEGPLLTSIVSYVNYSSIVDDEESGSSSTIDTSTAQVRAEAANVVASLAHGPREVLFGLLEADAPSAVLNALAALTDHDPPFLKVSIVRALRALLVAISGCAGPSLWELGEECLEFRSETRSTLDYVFQTQALDVYLPLLESSTPMLKLYIAQLLAFAVRIPKHRIAVTSWLPQAERVKESKGKRGWEVSALVDANSPSRQGGWVMRRLAAMLKSRDFALQEVALYAIAALVKDSPNIALVLSKTITEQKSSQSVLTVASDLTRDRRSEVRLAACLCVTNILRSNSNHERRLSSTIIHVLSAIISNTSEPAPNRAKACHILSWLVADDTGRCIDAWKSGALVKLADLVSSLTPTTKPQEWEDGEASDISNLREAALTSIASLAMLDNDIRNEIAGALNLLPLITVCLGHPSAGVRYGACQCIRALSRAIRVLRTSILDSGVGVTLCEIVENRDEDRRVTNIALAGLCNLLNEFSPLRQAVMNRGIIERISCLVRAPEDQLKISALWAVKNLVNKASTEDKVSIMKQVGWVYLKTLLVDPKEDVQEQALNIVGNIASSLDDISLVFQNIPGEELMRILADASESASDEVVCQATKVIGNISNSHTHRHSITSSPRILTSLRSNLTHHAADTRYAAISCVEVLARTHSYKLKEFGIDETLRGILRDTRGGEIGSLSSSSSGILDSGTFCGTMVLSSLSLPPFSLEGTAGAGAGVGGGGGGGAGGEVGVGTGTGIGIGGRRRLGGGGSASSVGTSVDNVHVLREMVQSALRAIEG
ncbi:ARM repeat-containing protein [Fomitiporia mediterranea MF3/22]|uniref:ARM repeat-containing protein n=1 Tax=Fomitiporia mediterranea (strain MF3/22) TaxID=694068 RepID=UPI0004409360|nr:ARM repeat-containing protein [Fomitiporia mediterranea MF3/22]EJD05875.1 ARM repeat-containing protein [Fomitiporia mediterranea MF3/22]